MARTCVMATVTRVLAELTVATAISTVACRKLHQPRKSGALSGARAEARARRRRRRRRRSCPRQRRTRGGDAVFPSVGRTHVKGACLMMGGALGAATAAATCGGLIDRGETIDVLGRRRGRGVGPVVRHPHRRGDVRVNPSRMDESDASTHLVIQHPPGARRTKPYWYTYPGIVTGEMLMMSRRSRPPSDPPLADAAVARFIRAWVGH